MSTATITPNITHLPHTAYPLPLREQAFTLHCQGLRSPAIAQALGVPERTVRAWIAAALDDLKDDIQLNRRQQLLLAVERQHQLTAAAWGQFEHEAAARDALLDAALAILHAATGPASATTDASAQPITVRLPASSLAPRYLSLILQADKEANRLLGLHTLAKLQLLSPDPDTTPTDSEIPAESATASVSSEFSAESATDTAARIPAVRPSIERAPAFQGRDSEIPAESATAHTADSKFAAESATASTPRCSSVSSVVNTPLPAKTATASGSPLLWEQGSRRSVACSEAKAGQGLGVRSPASPHPMRHSGRLPAKTPQPWMM